MVGALTQRRCPVQGYLARKATAPPDPCTLSPNPEHQLGCTHDAAWNNATQCPSCEGLWSAGVCGWVQEYPTRCNGVLFPADRASRGARYFTIDIPILDAVEWVLDLEVHT